MRNREFLEYLGVLGEKNIFNNIRDSEIEICNVFRKLNKLEGLDGRIVLKLLDRMIGLGYSLNEMEYIYRYWKKLTSVLKGINWSHEIYHLREVINMSTPSDLMIKLNNHKLKMVGFLKISLDEELYTIARECTLIGMDRDYKNVVYIAFDYDTDKYEMVYKIGTNDDKKKEFNQARYDRDADRLKIWIR